MEPVSRDEKQADTQYIPLARDFPTMASRAAIELDNLLRGRDVVFTAIDSLVDSLALEERADTKACAMSLVDPSTYVVLNTAIDTSLARVLPTVEQVFDETEKIRKRLQEVLSDPERSRAERREEIVELRAFCVALSRSATSYRRSLDDIEPKHPHRR